MLHRPHTTLVPLVSYPANHEKQAVAHAQGPALAAEEFFRAERKIMDPQLDEPVSMGTTICAFAYDGGVVLAADSRTSTGTYVVNRVSNKLTKLSKKIYCCRSGSAADTQAMAGHTAHYLEQYQYDIGREPTVAAAAGLFQRLCYNNKWNISAGIIVAGYDEINGGSVYSIPLGGSCVKLDYALGGSGSTYIYGFMDANFKVGMTKAECLDFARRAVAHALSRDGSSGGVIRTIAIDKDGEEHYTMPWSAIPYCMEKDPAFQKMAPVQTPVASSAKIGENQKDSEAQH